MDNCIFSAHCIEYECDKSCPVLAETSYLLERNGITMNSSVFHRDPAYLSMTADTLKRAEGKTKCVTADQTVATAELFTYVAICQNWKGNRLHCNVYNLRFSTFIEETKQSWSARSDSESLEYMRIWSNSAKVLIISHLDYVNFGDFEAQTLLNLLQVRDRPDLTTIVISPKLTQLVGKDKSMFFTKLQTVLSKAVKA